MGMGEPQHKSSLPLSPSSEAYDTLNTVVSSNWHKSMSAGTLPLPKSPARRDIYASEIYESRSNQRRISRHSMKAFDYSYVETEPKCVLLSPTGEHALGEVRHTSSDKSKPPQPPTIVTSDYSQVEDDMTYSSLNPVTSTNVLPQGLYNQLDYKPQDNQTDGLPESPPPPLPPPFITTPPTKRGYENIGSRSPRRSVNSEGSHNGLTDSASSLELCVAGEESPRIMRRSPRPSPHQSPLPPRRIQDQYDQTVIGPNPNMYNKVQRKVSGQQQKPFQVNSSDDSTGAYSKLVSTPSTERKTMNIALLSLDDDSNPYSQLSYKQTPPENEPSQHASHEVNDEGVYSKFTHNSVDDTTTQYNSTDVYSTLQSPNTPDKPVLPPPPTQISYEEVDYPSPPPFNSYEEVGPKITVPTGCNPYDEVAFTETTPPPSSKDVPSSSIYDDPPEVETPKQSVSLNLPPVPPRRGASMNSNRPQKPPPLKPKPYIPKK